MVNPNAPLPVLEGKMEQLVELCRRYHVKRLEIFGSAATDAFRLKSSDLDFLVDFGNEPLGPWAGLFVDFADSLEALFGRPVDLIMPLSIRNPYFRKAVEASRRLIYEARSEELLFDLIAACGDVVKFTAGKAFEDYLASEMLRAAVQRKFEIIGEALVRLRAKDPETFDQISAGQRAIAFRNRLVHGYNAIDHKTLWETVQNDLPALKTEAEQLLSDEHRHFLANKFLTFLNNVLTDLNITDVETGYKACRTEIAKNMNIESSGFGFEV